MDEPKRYDIPVEHCVGLMPSSAGKWLHRDDPAIVQAIAVRKACHEAGLLDERGNLRRIIGTLPMTADGCVAGDGASIYWWNPWLKGTFTQITDWQSPVKNTYSTREAAERAVKEQSDGH